MFKIKSKNMEFELWDDGDINIRVNGFTIGYFDKNDGLLHLIRRNDVVKKELKNGGLSFDSDGYISIFRDD